jgi:hypothetical protein
MSDEAKIANANPHGTGQRYPGRGRDAPRCGAKTRPGSPCMRKALSNGRCPNHGGLSTGPKTTEGRARIAACQCQRWARWRKARNPLLA